MTDLKHIIDEYFELGSYKSCLDGWFTSEELRLLADEMDRRYTRIMVIKANMKDIENECAIPDHYENNPYYIKLKEELMELEG